MTTSSTDALTYQGKTAEQWRAEAAASRKRSADSWERSDTDGFMSQWAGDLMAMEYDLKAKLAEAGGVIRVTAVFDAETGAVASTHLDSNKWGMFWVLNDQAAAKYGRRFLNVSEAASPKKRHAAMVKKGFTTGLISVEGYVAMKGANVTSVRPMTLASVDALKEGRYEVIITDIGPDDDRN